MASTAQISSSGGGGGVSGAGGVGGNSTSGGGGGASGAGDLKRAVVKSADMAEDMQAEAVEVAAQAVERFSVEKDVAAHVKKEFDRRHGPTWHCVVGRNFGTYVTHETKHFVYFYLGQVAVLLFKSG
jgi:dynein light chain LC8-type